MDAIKRQLLAYITPEDFSPHSIQIGSGDIVAYQYPPVKRRNTRP